jgi:hypothetical protein
VIVSCDTPASLSYHLMLLALGVPPDISVDAFDLPNFVMPSVHASEAGYLSRVWTIPELHA